MAFLDLVPPRRGTEVGSGSIKTGWKLKHHNASKVMCYCQANSDMNSKLMGSRKSSSLF